MTIEKTKHRDNVVELAATLDRGADSQSQGQWVAAPVAIVQRRRWAIDCTSPRLRNDLRERFERLAAHAAEVELGTKYGHRDQAVDAWLDRLKRDRKSEPEWRISLLLRASAERCQELKLRALANQQHWMAETWTEIDRQLRVLIAENPRDELYAIDDQAGEPSMVESPLLEGSAGGAAEPKRWTDRQVLVDAYRKEVLHRTGKWISKADIWRAAGDKCKTEFERWESRYYERHGSKGNVSAHQRFTRILTEKPHLKISPAIPRHSPPCAPPCGEPDTAIGTAKQALPGGSR